MVHKRITIGSLFFCYMLLFISCKTNNDATLSPQTTTQKPNEIKILTLGDSYTKGEGVAQTEGFPFQLRNRLEAEGDFTVKQLKVVAETGWTTTNLINALSANTIQDTFDLVTLLIGVNNQFQRLPIQNYETEFLELLQQAIGFAGNNKNKVIVISIPDYGVTPFGGNDAAMIGKDIDRYNAINKNIANIVGVDYINITPISRLADTDKTLIAQDDLHPSGKMYKLWVDKMLSNVIQKLGQ